MKKIIIEKPHRLKPEAYVGKKKVFFTVCMKQVLSNQGLLKLYNYSLEKFEQSAAKYNCSFPVYLFMPDHLHLVVNGLTEESETKTCVEYYKQLTGYWYKQESGLKLWQKDFYDRIIRDNRGLKNCTKYILMNPVKAGMVNNILEYSFWGSMVFGRNELVEKYN